MLAERGPDIARIELLDGLTRDLRETMERIYGDRLATSETKNSNDILPGIPNGILDIDVAAKIRQLLATLHEDGSWADVKEQHALTEQTMVRNRISFGPSIPDQGTEMLFSGNDKYGLTYGLITFESENIPPEQRTREMERVYLGWYVQLFNRYIQERPAAMYKIAHCVAKAGLPLQPWIQVWMKRHEQGL